MAQIFDSSYTSASAAPSSVVPNSYIVKFNELSDEASRKAHMDLVTAMNKHSAGIQIGLHYAGIQDVIDMLPGYAGVFRPEVVAWIRSQGDVDYVQENQEVSIN